MNASSIFLIFVLDFMIGVPVSLLLPTIGFNTRYKRSRNFREKSPEITKRIGKEDPLTSRLAFLFDVLQVHDANCQQKIICETLKDQQKFSPLSDLLLAIFRFDFLQTFKIHSNFIYDFYAGSQRELCLMEEKEIPTDGIFITMRTTLALMQKILVFAQKPSDLVLMIQQNF